MVRAGGSRPVVRKMFQNTRERIKRFVFRIISKDFVATRNPCVGCRVAKCLERNSLSEPFKKSRTSGLVLNGSRCKRFKRSKRENQYFKFLILLDDYF